MRTPYATCPMCQGVGSVVNAYTGELDSNCPWCRGDTVVRARDKKGRFTTVELEITSALWPPGKNQEGD